MQKYTLSRATSVRLLTVVSAALITVLAPTALLAQSVGPPDYTLEELNIFPPEDLALARDMNNRDQIVGTFAFSFEAWIYENGVTEMVEYPGADATTLYGINDRGTIFGYYRLNAGESERYGFSRDKQGNFTDINYPGNNVTRVNGGNNRGDAVGFIETATGPVGFTRSKNGVYTPHYPPNSLGSQAVGINEWGLVTGFFLSEVDFAVHGYTLSRKGVYTVVDYPGAAGSQVIRSNNRGDIVGVYSLTSPFVDFPEFSAYLMTRKGMLLDVSFPDPNSISEIADVNDRGDILATAIIFDPNTGAPSTVSYIWRK